jgi:hypothetical protein
MSDLHVKRIVEPLIDTRTIPSDFSKLGTVHMPGIGPYDRGLASGMHEAENLQSTMMKRPSSLADDGRHSLEREPWRAFKSSLAVEFTSRKRGGWSADRLSEDKQAEILSALEARIAIVRNYSRIRSALRDFLESAGALPPPADRFRSTDTEQFAYAKKVIARNRLFLAQASMIQELIDQVEELSDQVHLVVHGFVEVREDKTGDIRYFFSIRGKRQALTCPDLKAGALDLDLFFEELRRRLDGLSAALG